MEKGESAENGESQEKATEADTEEGPTSAENAKLGDMPDVPTKDLSDDGPAARKQKPGLDGSL